MEFSLFPLSMLLKEHSVEGSKFQKGTVSSLPRTSSEAIERFNEELVKMEGSLSFHNFHKLSPKALRETQRGDEKKKASSSKTEPVAIGTPSSFSTQDRNYFFDPWIKRDRSVQEKTRTVIYTCRAAAKPTSTAGGLWHGSDSGCRSLVLQRQQAYRGAPMGFGRRRVVVASAQ